MSDDDRYFEELERELDTALEIANSARKRGGDPVPEVEIPVAKDMADRVENILGIDGVARRVRELEGEMSREEAALELVEDFVDGSVGDYETRAGKVEGAVRTAVALLTEGVVAAPIEGIDRVELLENDDGTEFINVYYAGPIRSAGGTAQALSVLVADYARALLDIDEYKPRDIEVNRYAEEVALYDEETGLQYAPKEKEAKFIAKHMPIMLDGEATGDEEVSGFRDLDRVDTNSARGGMCLVFGEGIALKAPKIQRYTRNLDEIDWPWLQDLIDGNYKDGGTDDVADEEEDDAAEEAGEGDDDESKGEPEPDDEEPTGPPRAEPSKKFLQDLIAGRPVFSHPSESGGFRLRYGRARNHGHATAGIHPATMHLVDDFLATGTQIKTERPGKAAGMVPVDTIEGPTVRLANGEVRQVSDIDEALEIRNGIERILDLGEYLVNYGEFVENNHPLAPASYVYEWWVKEFEAAGAPVQAMRDGTTVDLTDPTPEQTLEWANEYDAPLHPKYTYLWHDVSVEAVEALAGAIEDGQLVATDGAMDAGTGSGHRDSSDDSKDLVVPRTEQVQTTLESLLVEHRQDEETLSIPDWQPLVRTLGFDDSFERNWDRDTLSERARTYDEGKNAILAISEIAPFEVRERAPTRIGNRMGRPEKSEERELSPAVHTLFPIGEAGGSQRSVTDAADHGDEVEETRGEIDVEVGRRECIECGTRTYHPRCPDCGGVAEAVYLCPDCDREVEPDESGRAECPNCETLARPTQTKTVHLRQEYKSALNNVGERESAFEKLKAVKGLSSKEKTPEPLEKGVLRAKHDVSAFKDGTIRYDMTDLPLTSVRPAELDVTVEQFRALGYHEDINGDELRHEDQLVELRVQDVVLSDGAAEHMLKTADFVDDLLTQYYGMEPYYELEDRDDLVGELVFGMAPHTSAATVGRVVGFTSAAVGYAHPYFHAAKRRNCFHPETKIWFRDGGNIGLAEKLDSGVSPEAEPQQTTIREFVESRLTNPDVDAAGVEVQEIESDTRVISYSKGLPSPNTVRAVSKHPSPDHLIEIHTDSGDSLRVTADHDMLRYDEQADSTELDEYRSERVPAQEIAVGDQVPAPSSETYAPAEDKISEYLYHGGREIHDRHSKTIEWRTVTDVEIIESDVEHVYCLEAEPSNTVCANGLLSGQCDGDEDCVMLLLDGLLNFSEKFLPNQRGGRMDAPLVMSSRIDPSEIDDEAHNVDIMREYPLEFYEATRELAETGDIEDAMTIAEETLGTESEYSGFDHTHDTTDIAAGPDLSAYKTLGSMQEKMDAQLALSRKIRAVDETDVAERIIEFHFLPDLLGNLKAFSSQEFRCLDCGEKYRRAPLSGDCPECGGRINLTVHEGSVNKYMDTAIQVAEEFGCEKYTKQRLDILETRIERIFEDDTNKQSGIADFM
jgi:DNA polymerase II large subunit